jgi:hypothetical protein
VELLSDTIQVRERACVACVAIIKRVEEAGRGRRETRGGN